MVVVREFHSYPSFLYVYVAVIVRRSGESRQQNKAFLSYETRVFSFIA